MERKRGFEIAKGFEDKGINLPVRKTKNAAGYDVEAAEDTIIPTFKPGQKPTLVKTGLKAYCEPDEFYMLCNRSSNPGKRGLVMANSVGIIDSDYYENEDNDGHFMFSFYKRSGNMQDRTFLSGRVQSESLIICSIYSSSSVKSSKPGESKNV